MSIFGDDKYADRAWDWAKDMSRYTYPGWQQIYEQSLGAATGGKLTPGSQGVMDYAQKTLQPYIQQQPLKNTDLWKTISGLFPQYQNLKPIFETGLYKNAENLYNPTVEPLYNQLMDPLKRGIEGQYGNTVDRMLSTGVKGGALTEALANAAMSRDERLSDMERSLRSQDIMRLDQTQRERAAALTDLASKIYSTRQAGQMAKSNALAGAATTLGGQRNNQGLMASLNLTNLLQQLSDADMARALGMANIGVQGRYGAGQNLASGEAGGNAGLQSGLMNMGSMLGLGLGSSGALTEMGSGLMGLFGGGGPEQLGQFWD